MNWTFGSTMSQWCYNGPRHHINQMNVQNICGKVRNNFVNFSEDDSRLHLWIESGPWVATATKFGLMYLYKTDRSLRTRPCEWTCSIELFMAMLVIFWIFPAPPTFIPHIGKAFNCWTIKKKYYSLFMYISPYHTSTLLLYSTKNPDNIPLFLSAVYKYILCASFAAFSGITCTWFWWSNNRMAFRKSLSVSWSSDTCWIL